MLPGAHRPKLNKGAVWLPEQLRSPPGAGCLHPHMWRAGQQDSPSLHANSGTWASFLRHGSGFKSRKAKPNGQTEQAALSFQRRMAGKDPMFSPVTSHEESPNGKCHTGVHRVLGKLFTRPLTNNKKVLSVMSKERPSTLLKMETCNCPKNSFCQPCWVVCT